MERAFAINSSPPRPVRKILELCHLLLSEKGEVSGAHLASETLNAFQALDRPTRHAFFDNLATEFSADPMRVRKSAEAYLAEPSAGHLMAVQRAVEPLRVELLRRLNLAPSGTARLVKMRESLLADLPSNRQWTAVSTDLEKLFSSWFNRGFLELRRIDWRTSASVLEKLIQFEAVHQIQGWEDLRRRLAADRRCYAYFHPALPDEPIIFIEVALTKGISSRVQPLLDPGSPVIDPSSADTAIFYSITNCQEGLRGVPFGSLLIKQVAEDLSATLPRLRRFSTLSPIPGFRAWLRKTIPQDAHLSHLAGLAEDSSWVNYPDIRAGLESVLVPLCAYYLLTVKLGREPIDAVARFHLRNGARLERINWLGDTSPTGMDRSCGLMANYVYRLSEVERNHELYTREERIICSYSIERTAQKLTKR